MSQDPAVPDAHNVVGPAPLEEAPGAVDVVDPEHLLPHEGPPVPAYGAVPSRNYLKAVELGHVLAASGYYADARDPAKAAVKVMVGMDLGISPTAALQAIHVIEKDGRVSFLIEAKLLAAVIKQRDGYDYTFVERTEEKVTVQFLRNGEPHEDPITWTMETAKRAGLLGRGQNMYQKYPREMLTWRCISEGVRAYFPELISGQPIYTFEEMAMDPDEAPSMREALDPGAQPLTDAKAEDQRAEARAIYDELKEVSPDRLPPGRFATMVAGAEHSHERLAAVIDALKDLRDTEREIAGLKAAVEEHLDAAEFKTLLGRVERKGSNRERIEILRSALPDDVVDQKLGLAPAEDEGNGTLTADRGKTEKFEAAQKEEGK